MKTRTYWIISLIVVGIVAFRLGFWLGQEHKPEGIYRADISFDYAAQNPDKVDELFLRHAELYYWLAKYKPPIDDEEIGIAVFEIQKAANNLRQVEKALRDRPNDP